MKRGELLETIAISIALLSLLPVALWWHTKELADKKIYFIYLFFVLCVMGYITYRRIKRLRAAFKSSEKRGSGRPPMPPFFR